MSSKINKQIKEAELDMLAAVNAGNAEAMFLHMGTNCDSFWPGGQSLYNSERSCRGIHSTFDSGFKFNLQYQDLYVKVFGDVAVATGYLVGTATAPDGITSAINWRKSILRIQQDGEWKVIHWHESPLISGD